ncbi:hypothetical protein MY4824_009638 [Beauveria thailandica]
MPSQEQIPQQQQPMAATNPTVEAARPSSEQPRPVEPMSVGLRGGHNGEGEIRPSAAVSALVSAASSAASAAANT